MSHLSRIFLPAAVLGLGIFSGLMLMATGPEATLRSPIPALPVVETHIVQPQNYQVLLRTQGTVTPRTQSTLIPEVAGRIVSISTRFRNGGSFSAGETLLVIAPTDYENAIIIARADLARAHLALEQKKALARNALNDWKKLGRTEQPTDLTLYKPQVASARADMAAAEAHLQQAETNLARTRIRAPYAGRVLEKKVDVGQYVAPGTVAATIYAMDAAEVRLPLTDSQLAFVDLPGFGEQNSKHQAAVTLRHRVGNRVHQWQGRLVRTDGAIDTASRQLFVVAQIDNPFQYKKQYQKQSNGNVPPLNIGQFVEADIQGQQLQDVFVLPRSAVEIGDTVLMVKKDGRIERRAVQVVLRRGEQVIVSAGLQAGERISLTPMPFAHDDTIVAVFGEKSSEGNIAYSTVPTLER